MSLYLKEIGGKASKLNLATLPEKCVWSSDSKEIFCAVPQNPSSGPMPDEYYQGLTYFSDSFTRIKPETGEITEILSEGNFDAQNLTITANKQKLFFVNRKDGILWGINLATSN